MSQLTRRELTNGDVHFPLNYDAVPRPSVPVVYSEPLGLSKYIYMCVCVLITPKSRGFNQLWCMVSLRGACGSYSHAVDEKSCLSLYQLGHLHWQRVKPLEASPMQSLKLHLMK